MSYSWLIYEKAGTYKGQPEINNPHQAQTILTIPADANGKDIQVILAISNLRKSKLPAPLHLAPWKSYYKIHCIKSCNYYRTLCYLYASLLLILINWEICSCWQSLGYLQLQRSLSILKLMKGSLQYKDEQRQWCKETMEHIARNLGKMFLNMLRNTRREKGKNRYNYGEIIDIIN